MIKSFFLSKKWAAWAYLGLFLLLSFLYIQTSLNVAINEWYKDFYDVLQKPKIQSKAEQKALLKANSNEKVVDVSNLAESNSQDSVNLGENSSSNSSEIHSENSSENLNEIHSENSNTNSPQIQAQKQFPKNSAQILSQNELENALKSLNLVILSDDNKSLNFALIYAKFKENNETLIKNAENLGLNFAKIKESTKKQAAAQKAQNQLENANFLNKFSLFFYQNLLEIFFDTRSISGEDAYAIDVFYELIWVFLCIALPYVLIATINVYFASIYALKWREAMTFEYLRFWKAKDDNIEGSSQRIQEDIYNFSKIVESLGLAFVRAMMILFAFIPILWALSGVISKPLFEGISDDSVFAVLKHIDGLLVYVAFFISLGGLAISWIVGIKLPGLEYNNQKAEAAFRKELVFAEDDRRNYASRETMIELFTGLKFNYKRLFLHYGYFNIWLILFEQIIVIVPLLIVAPSLFAGAIGLGVVMQMNNAFDQVRSSFSVFITNWTKITELRSIHKRLKEFEMNIEYRKVRK